MNPLATAQDGAYEELREQILDYFAAIGMAEPFDLNKCVVAYTEAIISLIRQHDRKLLEKVSREVIGANDERDEPFLTDRGGLSTMGPNYCRNDLRASQRAHLNELIKEMEGEK